MSDPQLDEYIKASRAAGDSDETIKASLKSVGWDEALVAEALSAKPATPAPTTGRFARMDLNYFKKYPKTMAGVIVAILLVIGGLKAYSYFTSNPDKIWADAQDKMLEIKSAKFKFEASYSEPPPKDGGEDDFFGLGGGPIKLSINGNGALSINRDKNDADYDMTSQLSSKFGSFTFSLDFESRKIGDYVFYKSGENALIGELFGGIAPADEKDAKYDWVKFNIKQTAGSELAIVDAQRTQIMDAFKKAKFMKPTKLINSEEIDGVNTWHYEAFLDKQEIKNYVLELDKLFEFSEVELKTVEAVVNKMEFKKLEIWIGKADHLVHQVLIQTNAPSVINGSTYYATSKSRDARRLADVRQIQTALELFLNDNGRYPIETNGQPTATDGGKNSRFVDYIYRYPIPPDQADGKCTDAENKYTYTRTSNTTYKLIFCLGHDSGGFKAGVMEASESGLKTLTPSNVGESDPLEGINFDSTIEIKLNLSDFNNFVKIDEPKDALDITEEYVSAPTKSRDARRLADVRQIMTGLELFYNDNGRYPTATNNQPTAKDGVSGAQFATYISIYPIAPTPADGTCTDANNKYTYTQLQSGASYTLTFCIGGDSGGFKKGIHTASPAGLQ